MVDISTHTIVTIKLNKQSLHQIKKIARHFNISKEDVIRNGIRLIQYAYEQDLINNHG